MIGCHKTYTHQECMKNLLKDAEGQNLSAQDEALFTMGVALECQKYNNDPNEVRKNLLND